MPSPNTRNPHVALFVTCLVDFLRPSVGFAAASLIEMAKCDLFVPKHQTCCGQPAYNNGNRSLAVALAKQTITAAEAYDYIVVPSGSCAGMLKRQYPALLGDDPSWSSRSIGFSEKVHELTEFLCDVRNITKLSVNFDGKVAVQDSCSSIREMGLSKQPRKLLQLISGLELVDLPDAETCCGFGGTFSVKYPYISGAIASRKCDEIEAAGCDLLVSCDLGCLLNLAGRLKRQGSAVEVRHIAELLVGKTSSPAIGDGLD